MENVRPQPAFGPACCATRADRPIGWLIVDVLLGLASWLLGVVTGLVTGTLLGWNMVAAVALGLAMAPVSCMVLTECPLARRALDMVRQWG